MIVIEKSIPHFPAKNAKFPWAQMQPGDSFFVGGYSVAKKVGMKHMCLSQLKKRYPGTSWSVRTAIENGIQGVRVWRVS